MKKLFAYLLAISLVSICSSCSSENQSASSVQSATEQESIVTPKPERYSSGDYTYIVLEDGTAMITMYNGEDDNLVIPDKLDGIVVTAIGDSAFFNVIRRYSSLASITIPNSVIRIESNPFGGCDHLTEFVVSPDHPYLETIDGVLFSKPDKRLICCPSAFAVYSYSIPDGIQAIGDYAFYGCTSLRSVKIPDSVTQAGANPFMSCSNLRDFIVSPDHPYLATIDGVLFSKPDKRLICYPRAFTADSYSIPKGIWRIGDNAFFHCGSLTSITIPDSVITIDYRAFYDCFSLTSVTIPNGVTIIGNGAFSGCGSLTSVTIPDSVTTIEDNVFANCYSLTSVTIPNGVTTIGDYMFFGCDSLTSVTIPDSVTIIGYRAFSNCDSLTSVIIPDGVITIGNQAFRICESLTSITIPDGVTTIGHLAFDKCESLTSVTIPDSVIFIGDLAFAYCPSLTVTVSRDSYAEKYCKENGVRYTYPDSLDWLNP